MTIKEYFLCYKRIIISNKNKFDTIEKFYQGCIKKVMLEKDVVCHWHKLFKKYSKSKDAILWVRQFEGGNKKYRRATGRWDTRRASVTRYSDGFSFVFVSNYDVAELYKMMYLGIKPTLQEFKSLMSNFEYLFHYDDGEKCEESKIAAYKKVGTIRSSVLNKDGWYLAHIAGIKETNYYINDELIDNKEFKGIFDRGELSDWKNISGHKIRIIKKNLSSKQKNLVKAHFLRFVDPLNYFIVPNTKNEKNSIYKNKKVSIGEYESLIDYMKYKFIKVYGSENMQDFNKIALVGVDNGLKERAQKAAKEKIVIRVGKR